MAEIDREITTGQAGYLRRRYLGGADETDGGQRRGLSVEEYLKMPYRMEIIPDAEEGGYTVIFPELPGRLTCGETMQEAMANVEEAKREWILCVFDDGQPILLPKNGHEIILLLNGRSSRCFFTVRMEINSKRTENVLLIGDENGTGRRSKRSAILVASALYVETGRASAYSHTMNRSAGTDLRKNMADCPVRNLIICDITHKMKI